MNDGEQVKPNTHHGVFIEVLSFDQRLFMSRQAERRTLFINEDAEVQSGAVTAPRPHVQRVAEMTQYPVPRCPAYALSTYSLALTTARPVPPGKGWAWVAFILPSMICPSLLAGLVLALQGQMAETERHQKGSPCGLEPGTRRSAVEECLTHSRCSINIC